jgi:hypothetical protein
MPMTADERERMNWLCQRIQEESDHAKFLALVRELNELLARKERQIEAPKKSA